MKKCFYCGEMLKMTAVRCKRCRNVFRLPDDAPFSLEKFYPPWGLSDIGIAYMLVLALTFIFYFVAIPIAMLAGVPLKNPKVESMLKVIDAYWGALVMLAVVYFTVCRKYKLRFLEALRLQPLSWPKTLAYAALGAALAVLARTMVHVFGIMVNTGHESYYDKMFDSYLAAVLFIFYGITLGPFFEEVLFRGLIYPSLNRKFGLVAAIIFTSMAFAAVHLTTRAQTNDVFVLYLVSAFGLTIVRALSLSTTASIVCHSAFNFTVFATAMLASSRV